MSEPACCGLSKALDALDLVNPSAPLLALGQTIFWDEPLKATVALANSRRKLSRSFIAGIHDTDYFAKLPSGARQPGKFVSLPHNDTSTRGLWSAAAEFSSLFGSETVVTREIMQSAGLRTALVDRERPSRLDAETEAFGWRGVVSLDEAPPITAELPTRGLFPVLVESLDWAMKQTTDCIQGASRENSIVKADELHRLLCDIDQIPSRLGDLYRQLVRHAYRFTAGQDLNLDVTVTTELLRFNTSTCARPRFELLDLFLRADSKQIARRAYDVSIQGGSGQYELARFGTGAIPFDLVIPGLGRGTIRIGNRGIVIMTSVPQFISLKKPVKDVAEFAELIERKFGDQCTVIGKAVALIGLLAREFVFVFHEGASGYVRHSRRMHDLLAEAGYRLPILPILRVKYQAWDALSATCVWFRLPEPLRRPFGTDELCSPSFAGRWREVCHEQRALLATLAKLRRPIELIEFLDGHDRGAWSRLSSEYAELRQKMDKVKRDVSTMQLERQGLYDQKRSLKSMLVQQERDLGVHWRAELFEKEDVGSPRYTREMEKRSLMKSEIESTRQQLRELALAMEQLKRKQAELVSSDMVSQVHARRRQIELEAELRRMGMIREAVISSRGLENANFRPAAWWMPVVSPDGSWFRETMRTAEAYLEPLISPEPLHA